ncbi:hypothetical protein D770_22015 [Flammeovirgaceae bacterium 311]|nr:hypothetical protein D770_22015 [Flammeovirgaceae bacterium 311]
MQSTQAVFSIWSGSGRCRGNRTIPVGKKWLYMYLETNFETESWQVVFTGHTEERQACCQKDKASQNTTFYQ